MADILGPTGNSIGFLRFALAALVVLHHSRVLGDHGGDPLSRLSRGQMDLGVLAVSGFFALSGLLITRSATYASPGRYLLHRVLRIFPAFWACLLVSVLVIAPAYWLVQHGSVAGYSSAAPETPLGYVVQNMTLFIRQTRIGDLLADNPYPSAINGSLWTLAYEFSWYLVIGALAVVGLLRTTNRAAIGLGLLVLVEVSGVTRVFAGVPVLGYALSSRFGLAFTLGAAAYIWRDRIPLDDRLAALAAVVFVVSMRTGTFAVFGEAALVYGMLWAAWRVPLKRFDARYDVSYGLYIYAFPVQQGLALAGIGALPVPVFFAISMAVIVPLAFASYVLVERPALRLKNASLSSIRQMGRLRDAPGMPRRAAPGPDERAATLRIPAAPDRVVDEGPATETSSAAPGP